MSRRRQPVRLKLDVSEFSDLLEAAETPRDRMVLALGLLLFLRPEEISSLRVKDVDLDGGSVEVSVKAGQMRDAWFESDHMPICKELKAELRYWLACYAKQVGVLNPDDYLVPGRRMFRTVYSPATDTFVSRDEPAETLLPSEKLAKPGKIASRALQKLGYSTVDADTGQANMLGNHVLRRSGAYAMFNNLRDRGYDGALQVVRVMLHHRSVRTTELYLGLDGLFDIDRRRFDVFRDKELFPEMHQETDLVRTTPDGGTD